MPPAAAAAIAPRRVAFPTFPRSVSLKWIRISAHVAISLFLRPRRPSRQSHQSLVVANRASAVVVVVVAAAAEVEGETANAANAVNAAALDGGPYRRGRGLRRAPGSGVSCVRASADGADRAALRRARDGVRLFHVRDALVFERRDRTAGLSRSRFDSRTRTRRRAADDAAAAWRGAALRRARATLSGAG